MLGHRDDKPNFFPLAGLAVVCQGVRAVADVLLRKRQDRGNKNSAAVCMRHRITNVRLKNRIARDPSERQPTETLALPVVSGGMIDVVSSGIVSNITVAW